MSNPVCSTTTLVTNVACFQGTVLDDQHYLALKIYFGVLELAALGGTNYTNGLSGVGTGTLITDTAALFQTMNLDDLKTSDLAIAYGNAVASGAAPSSNINTLAQNIKCLINTPYHELERKWLLIKCKLGVHKSYPQ